MQASDESDFDFLLRCMKGNRHATQWCLDLGLVADVWDNLIDGDVPVTARDVDSLCSTALLSMACNPFFKLYSDELAPVMRASIRNWKIANAMSFGSLESRIQSHVLRYSPIDALITCAAIVGGEDWAVEVGPAIRERHMRDPLEHYLQELSDRDGAMKSDVAP